MQRLQTDRARPGHYLGTFFFCLAAMLVSAGLWSHQVFAADYVFDTKNPVFGAGCPTCTLGASGVFVREALKLEGKSIRLCDTCVGPKGPLYISEHRVPPPISVLPDNQGVGVDPQPTDPVAFGATSGLIRVEWAYKGTNIFRAGGPYQSTGAHRHMRAIALIEAPIYTVAAVHVESGIKSLDELKLRKGLKIAANLDPQDPTIPQEILDYYGLTADVRKANGDTIVPDESQGADLLVSAGAASDASVEDNFWVSVTVKNNLYFLPLADPLRAQLVKDFPHYLRQGVMPRSYFLGVDKAVPTVVRMGHLIYGSDDMPEQYAYDLARALDRHQDLLKSMYIRMYYDKNTVAYAGIIPLHPGAAHYREVGYLK